jgi:hypothetical protein
MKTKIQKDDVKEAAENLIDIYGSTTTLDIKKSLRNKGFFALQEDVSNFMDELHSEGKFSFTTNGIHRIYKDYNASIINSNYPISSNSKFSNTGGVKTTVKKPLFSFTSSTKKQSKSRKKSTTPVTASPGNPHATKNMYQMRDGRQILSKNSLYITSNDWIVTTVNHDTLYFDGSYTRDEVRQATSKILGYHFHKTRARRKK